MKMLNFKITKKRR